MVRCGDVGEAEEGCAKGRAMLRDDVVVDEVR